MFATHGIPHKVITDNGPPFQSKIFKEFMKNNGITHYHITPLHPKANGAAETFMRNLNKTLRTAVLDQTRWKLTLYNFQLHYRNVPHKTT